MGIPIPTAALCVALDATYLVDDVVCVDVVGVIVLSFVVSECVSVGQVVNGDSQEHVEQDV